jgi:hypothetical protein
MLLVLLALLYNFADAPAAGNALGLQVQPGKIKTGLI